MATRKKTTAPEQEVKEEVTAVQQPDDPSPAPAPEKKEPEKKKFAPDDMIHCTSVTVGELLCSGPRTGISYHAFGYGDEMYIQYQDLVALKMKKSQYLYAPHFVIEDEDLLNDPMWEDVKEIMEKVYADENLDDFFRLPPAKMKTVLKAAPRGFQNAVRVMAMTKIDEGELDSVNRIKVLDEVLGTDFKSLM